MRILVTGAKGFIGRLLLDELREAGHETTGTDIVGGLGSDLRESENVERLLKREPLDVVVHLAYQQPNGDDDVDAAATNMTMAARVAHACGELGIRLVCGSSGAVYGEGASVSREVEGPFVLPSKIDALASLWGEQAGQTFAPDGFTSLRFTGLYGPGQPGGAYASTVIEMLWRAREGMPMPVGPGERAVCWIADAVRAARIAIEKGDGPLNIGRDDEVVAHARIAELACIILGASPDLIERLPSESPTRRVSVSRMQRIGYRPEMALYDGMVALAADWLPQIDSEGRVYNQRVFA